MWYLFLYDDICYLRTIIYFFNLIEINKVEAINEATWGAKMEAKCGMKMEAKLGVICDSK